MSTPKDDRTPAEKKANAAKLTAEARKAEAEAAKAEVETEVARLRADTELLLLERERTAQAFAKEKEAARLADDDHQRVYRFLDGVGAGSVKDCIASLVRWSRIEPGCDMTIIIDSPGGNIIDGFHLFDTILELRRAGHSITTIAQGMAASMGGVLLQAGDVRVMTEQSALLIHEASFGAMGSYGKIEDQVEFVKKLQARILRIFAERSGMSAEDIENKWHRKDWWMMADEALEYGFCDEIRGLQVGVKTTG